MSTAAYDEVPGFWSVCFVSLTVVQNVRTARQSPSKPLDRRRPTERLLLFIGREIHPDGDVIALLRRAGSKPLCMTGIAQALQAASHVYVDGAIVDAALLHPPEEAWLSKLRLGLECPLLVLADHADEVDEIMALEQGADDYLVRPVGSRRLSARLTALVRQPVEVRHRPLQKVAHLQVGGWSLDPMLSVVRRGELCARLTPLLCALLGVLFENQGNLVLREQLLQCARSSGSLNAAQGVSTYVHRLRRRLREQGALDLDITCVSARGYMLRVKT